MIWIVLTFGSLATVAILAMLVSPKIMRNVINYFLAGNRLYITGFVRTTIGIMLLILAPRARLWCYVAVIGLICTASGVSIFFFSLRRSKKLLTRIRNHSDFALRLYAFLVLTMWIFLFYSLTEAIPTLPR
ncbi:MAG: hypothetical protein JW869_01980 [Candidatus Omnitrophica bacterium]|nr:hypothetical protein [Candidatus Omnitrophota bacterium]